MWSGVRSWGAVVALALLPVWAGESLKVGDRFPDLKQFNLEGKLPETLSGRVLLVDFWASWCGPCKASFPVLGDLQKQFGDRGLVVVAISVDEKASAMQGFLKKHPAGFTVVRDLDQRLVQAANVATMPTSFLVDRNGKICAVHNGFHGEETRNAYLREIESLVEPSH